MRLRIRRLIRFKFYLLFTFMPFLKSTFAWGPIWLPLSKVCVKPWLPFSEYVSTKKNTNIWIYWICCFFLTPSLLYVELRWRSKCIFYQIQKYLLKCRYLYLYKICICISNYCFHVILHASQFYLVQAFNNALTLGYFFFFIPMESLSVLKWVNFEHDMKKNAGFVV